MSPLGFMAVFSFSDMFSAINIYIYIYRLVLEGTS